MADTQLALRLPRERPAHWPWGWAVIGFVAQAELESPEMGPWLAHSLFALPHQVSVSSSGKWRSR